MPQQVNLEHQLVSDDWKRVDATAGASKDKTNVLTAITGVRRPQPCTELLLD